MDWLVIDASSVGWRVFHSQGQHDPMLSLVMTVSESFQLAQHFEVSNVVWAFDRKPYLRAMLFPGYKRKIREVDEEVARREDEFRGAMDRLRSTYLEELGFTNLYSKAGYEADDIMAAIVQGLSDGDRAILVSSDKDLYQLLSRKAAVYHPGKIGQFVTAKWFKEEYGIYPALWAEVKALAGCQADKIPGMPGVAEATALAFFRKELIGKPKHARILEFNRSENYRLYRKLVSLPYSGIDPITLKPDKAPSRQALTQFADRLGIAASVI